MTKTGCEVLALLQQVFSVSFLYSGCQWTLTYCFRLNIRIDEASVASSEVWWILT